ncbi:hypothetical protein PC122_g15032 [Phytophthora cactorum]|nr:hypothetical protein PC122_g15032 [Phytophthora cactorum]
MYTNRRAQPSSGDMDCQPSADPVNIRGVRRRVHDNRIFGEDDATGFNQSHPGSVPAQPRIALQAIQLGQATFDEYIVKPATYEDPAADGARGDCRNLEQQRGQDSVFVYQGVVPRAEP